ncbi:hypothetical protein RN001_000404 [Aquatica leii]|uniref:Uncharacterized protein n=1 Tax=Aquatica leii TaxID=1421715 RepID=A0AAN7QM10_9COLE|nr:hypothetical protein RN001_000404 [Aquatica leii]
MNQPKTLSCGTSSNIHDSQPLAEVSTAIQDGASTTTWVPKQLVATSISSPQLPGCSSNSAPTTPSSSALKTTKNLRSRTLYSFRKNNLISRSKESSRLICYDRLWSEATKFRKNAMNC